MLYRDRLAQALEAKRDTFSRDMLRRSEALDRYSAALDQAARLPRAELDSRLAAVAAPGALPTDEYDRGLIIPFAEDWEHGDQARAWALRTLAGATTVAVDGSQLVPSKEFGVPIGLVQVGWFENHHDGNRPYVKDVCIEVLTLEDLAGDADEPIFLSEGINQRRFELEVARIVEYLETMPAKPTPLVFFDGSLVLSFAGHMRQESRARYVDAIVRAIAASTRHRVPFAGYIDTSYARDLANMVGHACGLAGAPSVHDAQLLAQRMRPFDRTAAFVCARGDVLGGYHDENDDYSRQVGFVYLKTGAHHPPSRIEFPLWLAAGRDDAFTAEAQRSQSSTEESGAQQAQGAGQLHGPEQSQGSGQPQGLPLLDRIIDLVRAEIVVGTGYPYALETADATAVLTTEDRMAFYRLFHDFAESHGIHFGLTGKMSSKRRRR